MNPPEIARFSSERGLPLANRIATMAESEGDEKRARGDMVKRTQAKCSDCYFRRAGLCALPGDNPCPTFRVATAGALEPPRQPSLVPIPAAASFAVA